MGKYPHISSLRFFHAKIYTLYYDDQYRHNAILCCWSGQDCSVTFTSVYLSPPVTFHLGHLSLQVTFHPRSPFTSSHFSHPVTFHLWSPFISSHFLPPDTFHVGSPFILDHLLPLVSFHLQSAFIWSHFTCSHVIYKITFDL